MFMKSKAQKFEAVKFKRGSREELRRLYSDNPKEYNKKFEEVRKKYPVKFAKRKRNETYHNLSAMADIG